MDFFGYMEGAVRSGERAARNVIQQTCGWSGMKVA
jgi:monoamine oxidase